MVAGDLWAIPVQVTEAREFWNRLVIEKTAATAAGTIRWGVYDDVGWDAYPGEIVSEPTAASGALTTGTLAGTVLSPTSGNGSFQTVMDPGLYWLSLLVVTAGTTVTLVTLDGPNGVMANANTTGASFQTLGSIPNGYKLTGQGTSAMPTSWPAAGVATAGAPYIGFQVNINATN